MSFDFFVCPVVDGLGGGMVVCCYCCWWWWWYGRIVGATTELLCVWGSFLVGKRNNGEEANLDPNHLKRTPARRSCEERAVCADVRSAFFGLHSSIVRRVPFSIILSIVVACGEGQSPHCHYVSRTSTLSATALPILPLECRLHLPLLRFS